MRIIFLTIVTMIAFAGNSIFARLGLISADVANVTIDPSSYTLIRLISGTVMLTLIASMKNHQIPAIVKSGNWISAIALFAYAAAFSFAYVRLETGIGALILFSCVQGTMIIWALYKGDRPATLEWVGLIIAFASFIWLVSPGISAPHTLAACLMIISGIAWGIYSIKGKNAQNPLAATAGNFLLAVPFAILLLIFTVQQSNLTAFGVFMAIGSGAITSALGYALWYYVLGNISQTQAAIVQLTVPVFAGVGGFLLLGEAWSFRFAVASLLILGGVGLATLAKTKRT